MRFQLSSYLSISDAAPTSDGSIPSVRGFTYAEETETEVNWHISEYFTEGGASWQSINPDLAIVDGVLFAAAYILDDELANEGLEYIAEYINEEKDITEDVYTKYLEYAFKVSEKYHWTLTMWPTTKFRWSWSLLNFPTNTLYFLHSEENGPLGDAD